MKTSTIIILIIAGSLLLLGITCLTVFSAINGFNFSNMFVNGNYTENVLEFSPSEVSSVYTSLGVSNLRVTVSPDEKVHLKYYEYNGEKYSVTTENGRLSVVCDAKPFRVNFYIDLSERTAELSLPANFSGDMSLNSSTGRITVNGFHSCGNISTSASTGKTRFENISAKNITASTTTAAIEAEDIRSDGIVKFSVSTGSIRVDDVKAEEAKLTSTTGSIRIDGLDAMDIRLKSSTGGISGDLEGSQSEYSITSSTSTGSCNLPENFGKGNRKLDARATTGSIHITFDD